MGIVRQTWRGLRPWLKSVLLGMVAIVVTWAAGKLLDRIAPEFLAKVWTAMTAIPIGWFGLVVGLWVVAAFTWAVWRFHRSLKATEKQQPQIADLERELARVQNDAAARRQEYQSWMEQVIGTPKEDREPGYLPRQDMRHWFVTGARQAHETLASLCLDVLNTSQELLSESVEISGRR